MSLRNFRLSTESKVWFTFEEGKVAAKAIQKLGGRVRVKEMLYRNYQTRNSLPQSQDLTKCPTCGSWSVADLNFDFHHNNRWDRDVSTDDWETISIDKNGHVFHGENGT